MLERSLTVDVLKVVAAQLIVWHHFSAYGPMADTMTLMWPQLMEWLYRYARLAVQVFLVVGGYLAAQSVMHKSIQHPLISIVKRYLRLVPFYVFALALISVAVAVSRDTIHASWLPGEPTVWQFLAHGFLAHDLLGFEALSSGAWYVAIDFQLYVSFAVLMCLLPRGASRVPPPLTIGCVAVLTVVSWFGFNHYSELDVWALYFWGAYGLGVLAAWARASLVARGLLTLLLLMLLVDAAMAFRVRPVLAAVTAWALWVVGERDDLPPILRATWQALSDASYAIFVVHFAVILGFSAAWSRHASDSTLWAWSFFGLAWLVSVGLGMALNRWVKTPKNWTGIHRA